MKVWVDSHREPEVDWAWSKMPVSATRMLAGGCVEKISLAPDQPELTGPVTEWMDSHDVHPITTTHGSTDGVRFPRGLMKVKIKAVS